MAANLDLRRLNALRHLNEAHSFLILSNLSQLYPRAQLRGVGAFSVGATSRMLRMKSAVGALVCPLLVTSPDLFGDGQIPSR
jgi:hypothetical protein